MKKSTILLLLLSFFLNSYAQINFIKELKHNSKSLYFSDIVQLQNNDYIVSTFFIDSINEKGNAFLYHLDSLGNIIETKEFSNPDSNWWFIQIEKYKDSNFLSIELISDTSLYNEYYVGEYDKNLNLVSRKKYLLPEKSDVFKVRFKVVDTIVMFYYNPMYTGLGFLQYINKDTTLYYQDTMYFNEFNIHSPDFFYAINTIFEEGLSVPKSFISKISLDNYSFTKSSNIFDSTQIFNEGMFTYIEIINNKIYLTYLTNSEQSDFDFIVLKIDTSLNVINSVRMANDFEEIDVMYRSTDTQHKKSIYFLYTNLYNNIFEIAKIDTNLNIIYNKFIEIENDYNNGICQIIATNDDGCMVAINVYGSEQYIILYKFDADGNLPANINDKIKISNFQLYPIPASDILKIRKAVQIPSAEFVLYNSLGQIVLQKTLSESTTEINISALSNGVYVYNIFVDGKLDDEGKVVVE